MDHKSHDRKVQIQSLFLSLKRTMNQLGINGEGLMTDDASFILKFSTQHKLIMSKLPTDFRKYVMKKMLYRYDPSDMGDLYKYLVETAAEYDGNWDEHKDEKSLHDVEVEQLAEEHYFNYNIRTRSKAKNHN